MGCHMLKCLCGTHHYLPQRYIVAIMSLTGILVGYGQRVSLNIAITEMADKNMSRSNSCSLQPEHFITTKKKISGGVIPWTNTQQNAVLGAFYPGYLIGHIPSGIWSDKYGGRYVFCIGMALSTVTTILTPIIVRYTPFYVTGILRSTMGIGQSVMYPSISVLYARWVPAEERSMLGAFSFAANSLGVICGNLFTGTIISIIGNWPIGFYFWGALGVLWCTLFMVYVYSEPSTSRHLTDREKTFLEGKMHKANKDMKIPWRGFFSDMGIWALLICEIGHDFTIFTLVNNFPKYMSDVIHLGFQENTLASSVPYLGQWIGGLVAGEILDYLIKKKGASIRWCRIISTSIGMIVPPIFIVIAGYMKCNAAYVIAMFSLNLFFKGPLYCGMKVNHLDMSYNFAGILMALTNGIGALAGYASPEVINLVAPNNELHEWLLVFWIVFAVALVTNLFYVIFCKAKRRKWDVPPDEMESFLQGVEEEKQKHQQKKDDKQKKKEEKKEKRKGKKADQKDKEEPKTSK